MAPRKSTQSQSQSAKSKGKKRARRDEDDEEEEEDAPASEDEATQKGKKEKLSQEGIARYAASVVRLALFSEQKKGSVRRDDITKKILGKDSRAFQEVFDAAQRILHKTFGMELVQLRGKGKGAGGDDGDVGEDVAGSNGAAAKKKGKGKKKKKGSDEEDDGEEDGDGEVAATMRKRRKTVPTGPARAWMLRSTLPAELYHLAAEPHPELPSHLDHLDEDPDSERRPPSGAVIDFKFGDDIALIGLLHAILSLILVNGRRLSDQTLRSYLRRLNLESSTPLPTAPTSPSQTLESFLSLLVRNLYLEKAKIAGADTGRGNDGEDLSIEWMWGARADAEIGESGLTDWVGEVFLEEDADNNAGEGEGEEGGGGGGETAAERKRREERREKRGQRLRKEIARAAGGALQD